MTTKVKARVDELTWESKQSLRAFVHRMTMRRCHGGNLGPNDVNADNAKDGAALITKHTPQQQQQHNGGGGGNDSLGASTQTATTVAIEDENEDEHEDA